MSSVIDEGGYGRFGRLLACRVGTVIHLDDEDRRLIEARRRDYNRLGFALQVVTVRHLGMFLPDPLEVPPELVGYLPRRRPQATSSTLLSRRVGVALQRFSG